MEIIRRRPVEMWRWWERCVGSDRKTGRECVKDDMDELGLHPEWVICGEASYRGKCLTLAERVGNGLFQNK